MASESRSPVPSEATPSRATRRAIVLLGLTGLLGAVLVLHHLGARPPAWYPPCPFHAVTGLFCPGCGSARAVHALGQGMVVRAVDHNLLAVAMLPVLVVWTAVTARRVWAGRSFSAALPGGWAISVLIAAAIFTVLRNLPWWPLVLLAPG